MPKYLNYTTLTIEYELDFCQEYIDAIEKLFKPTDFVFRLKIEEVNE